LQLCQIETGQGQGDRGQGQEGVMAVVRGLNGVRLPVIDKAKGATGGEG